MKPKTILTFLTLMLCVGVICMPQTQAFAGTPDRVPAFASAEPEPERLTVTTAWTDGELLHIEVRDNQTGMVSAIELRPGDYAGNAKTITIQAVDGNGRKSGVVTIANPYYTAPASENTDTGTDTTPADNTPPETESALPDGPKPFTPDGTGGVTDNAAEQDGKEFFTITTENGNIFYLIVDRQKSGENVYLLNTVTEHDLKALAAKGDGTTQSVIPDPEPTPVPPTPTHEPSPEPEPDPTAKASGGNGRLIFIIPAIVVIGGAGYYIKIVKPKKQASEGYEDESDFEEESNLSEEDEDEGEDVP